MPSEEFHKNHRCCRSWDEGLEVEVRCTPLVFRVYVVVSLLRIVDEGILSFDSSLELLWTDSKGWSAPTEVETFYWRQLGFRFDLFLGFLEQTLIGLWVVFTEASKGLGLLLSDFSL